LIYFNIFLKKFLLLNNDIAAFTGYVSGYVHVNCKTFCILRIYTYRW